MGAVDLEVWHEYALVLLKLDEFEEYRSTCKRMLKRFAQTEGPQTQAKKAKGGAGGDGTHEDCLFLAMAYHSQGSDAEARRWLSVALRIKLSSWLPRLEWELLRREAEELLEGQKP
jgi:hypothetical protein